jgi:hypothetical protein
VSAAVGVSAAADDRTFVVGRRDSWGNVDYFLVRVTPGAKQAATQFSFRPLGQWYSGPAF